MPYLGNVPATNFSTVAYQDLTGGSGTSFTLNHPAGSAQDIEVFVNNVRQEPGVAYTVAGTAMTMTGTVASTDDFYVVFQGKAIQTVVPGDNTITAAMLQSGAVVTKATSNPTVSTNGTQGDLYLNKTTGEMWCLTDATTNANVWTNIGDGTGDITPTYQAKLLLVAGGGGGGSTTGGGGGGGEVLFASSFTLTIGNTYSVTVGAGGAGAIYNTSASTVGGSTSFGSAATAIGGGGGGTGATSPTVGGSGGGASSASGSTGAAASGTSVSGFTTYGNAGGTNAGGTASAAGGGGAGGAGGNAGVNGSVGGLGGVGIDLSSHFGTSVGADSGYFAGGGGGGSQSNTGGGAASGGLGGGGTAQANASTGEAGTANTGGGGAGGGWSTNYGNGGNGGSGVVIIRYSGSQQGTGGTVTSPSGDTMHVFTSSGTFTA
jgi:hypothetical protein